MIRLTPVLAVLIMISCGYAFGQGQINVQNGNINHFYEDFHIPGHGYDLKLERSWNSLSKYKKGMFGPRWGSNFDMQFTQTPEGTVEITEFGGGFKTTFATEGFSQKDINAFVDKLYNKIPAASRSAKLKKDLRKDTQLRRKLAREQKFAVPIALNTKLVSNVRGPETLTKIKKQGYKPWVWLRTFADGRKEFFNSKGQLVRREDTNKNYLKLKTGKSGRINVISDRSGRQITFKYDAKGRVVSITTPLGKKCIYRYDKKTGDLIFARNDRGFEFKHKYNNNHLMTEVIYPKNEKENMKYDLMGRITFHEGPSDIKTTYKYNDKGKPDKYFNVIVTKEIGKKPNQVITVDKYEYEFGRRDNGARFAHKLATVLDGIRTETIYSECCGKPLSIKRQGETTRFTYFPNGTLKNKTSPNGESVSLQYDNKFGKVSQVTKTSAKTKKSDTTKYKYDKKGNLAYAQNEQRNIHVSLVYDTKGRIKHLLDQSGKKIEFQYNELGKPTKITLKGVGSIIVSYSAGGQITNVTSTKGRKIATEVTSAFQSLLDVIRPAGVSLNI